MKKTDLNFVETLTGDQTPIFAENNCRMIEIDEHDYRAVAVVLSDAIDGKEFFSGSVEYRCDSFYSTLTATLIVHYSDRECENTGETANDLSNGPEVCAGLSAVVPVWWEFSTTLPDGGQTFNDFSFSGLIPFLVAS